VSLDALARSGYKAAPLAQEEERGQEALATSPQVIVNGSAGSQDLNDKAQDSILEVGRIGIYDLDVKAEQKHTGQEHWDGQDRNVDVGWCDYTEYGQHGGVAQEGVDLVAEDGGFVTVAHPGRSRIGMMPRSQQCGVQDQPTAGDDAQSGQLPYQADHEKEQRHQTQVLMTLPVMPLADDAGRTLGIARETLATANSCCFLRYWMTM